MSNIPTAEETLARVIAIFPEEGDMTNESIKRNVHKMMIEFAKLHVKAALEAALESIPCLGSSTDITTYEEVKEEVLNAYPLKLII